MEPKPDILDILKPWETPTRPFYPQRKQILTISFLVAIWLHVLLFGLWQISGVTTLLAADQVYDLPIMEISLNVTQEGYQEASLAYGTKESAAMESIDPARLPALHEDLNKAQAETLPLSEEDLKALAQAPLTMETGGTPGPGDQAALDESFDMLEKAPPQVKNYTTGTKAKILKNWIFPPNVYKSGSLVVGVTIDRDGTLTRILIKESSGDAILDHAALEAIKASSPFDPFPANMRNLKQYTYDMKFEYNIKKAAAGKSKKSKKRRK